MTLLPSRNQSARKCPILNEFYFSASQEIRDYTSNNNNNNDNNNNYNNNNNNNNNNNILTTFFVPEKLDNFKKCR